MKKENIPNALTLIRVVMIPIFIAILSLSHSYLGHIVAAVIFAIASITDYLDGFLARKWNVVIFHQSIMKLRCINSTFMQKFLIQ